MAYTRVTWAEDVAVNAANLNTMDKGIEDLDQARKVVQMVTATCTSDSNSTTSTTYTNTTLTADITPLFDDSILLVFVSGDIYQNIYRVQLRIYNSTDSVALTGADDVYYEVSPEGLGGIESGVGLMGIYTVDSVAERTFVLQYLSGNAGQSARFCYRTTGLMIVLEVRP